MQTRARARTPIPLLGLLVLGLSGIAAAGAPKPNVMVLPLPSREVLPPDQDLVMANMASELRAQFQVRVTTGRAMGRAIWGTLGSGLEEASMTFTDKVNRGKQAYQMLQIGKAVKLLDQARKPLPLCGPEIRDPQSFVDLHLYTGLAHLAKGRKKKAAAEFRQAVSMQNGFKPSSDEFPPDVTRTFDKAKRQLLSRKPTSVKFLSRPEGAELYLDGQNRGTTPVTVPVYPGYHFIRVEREGFSPWTLNLPDGVAPASVKAKLVPLWTGDPPEDLVSSAIATEDLSESVRARLRLLAGFYRVDAIVMISLNREASDIHLGMRLFVVDPEIVTRARLFNLGKSRSDFPKKLAGIVSTLKPIQQAQTRQAVAAAQPSTFTPEPDATPPPRADPPRRKRPSWAQPIESDPPPETTQPTQQARPTQPTRRAKPEPVRTVVPIDEQVEDDDRYGGSGTAWYKSWWFWTITGVVVAGAAAGVAVYMTQPESSWTLVVQPNL